MTKKNQNLEFISLKLKQIRDQCGWNQSKLAKASGVTASAISMIENGQRFPSLAVIRKIAEALKVSVSELTGESSQDETNQEAQAFFRKFSTINELDDSDKDIILGLANSLKERSDDKSSD